MVQATSVNSSQGVVITGLRVLSDIQSSQGYAFAALGYPAQEMISSQASVQVTFRQQSDIKVSQASGFAAARGRVYNPKLRAWTFDLDGHEFYVLRLAEEKTLVYDLTTEQWSWWSSETFDFWRANIGTNWSSAGSIPFEHGSDVVVGDDSFGLLWILNPEQGYDDSPYLAQRDAGEFKTFPRVATGQVITRMNNTIPVYKAYLTGSIGEPAYQSAKVSLAYSDNLGRTFNVADADVELTIDDFEQEIVWLSLGQYSAPGRIFQLRDDGALARIDGLDIDDDPSEP